MDFSEAERRFQELQARIQRGEPLTEEQYQEEMQKLMVQDEHGTFWSPEPGTGQWLYFNGTEWLPGTPPGRGGTAQPLPPTMGGPEAGPAQAASPLRPMEAEGVPTYVRPAESGLGAGERGGIPPRPVRVGGFPLGEENTPWLPFAIGAVVLLLCAVVLFFGVRNLPGIGAAAVKPTPTEEVAAEEPTAAEEAPTDTPQAVSPTPKPTATVKAITATTKDRLRVRAGPGTSFGVLATLDSGTAVTPVGRNQDSSWLQIQVPGGSDLGWVSVQFLSVDGDANSLPVVQAQGNASPTSKP